MTSNLLFEPGTIYRGDCLDVLQSFPNECVDLIYIDPPFHSGRNYEVLWDDVQARRAFDDRWGDIKRYLDYMRPRVLELHRVLKRTGSFYYHCDWHAGHYIKVMLDELFGIERFQNEVVWFYQVGGKSSKRFARKHDTILFYSKSNVWTFNGKDVGIPRKTGKSSFGGKLGVDQNGRQYQDKVAKSGKVYRYYLDEGKVPEDVWEIQTIQSQDAERLGYPTQKPLTLLERIIKASSNKDEIVLDAFCGCGTALVASEMSARRWIGIDVSPTACRLMAERLERDCGMTEFPITGKLDPIKKYYKLTNMPMDEATLRKLPPFEFQNWAVMQLGKVLRSPAQVARTFVNDKGIDGKIYLVDSVSLVAKDKETLFGEKTPYIPVQVKQMDKVGRPDIDKFETALKRDERTSGFFVAFDFTRDSFNEIRRCRENEGLRIYPFKVVDLIREDFQAELIAWRDLGE